MGYVRHHAIICTGFDNDRVVTARKMIIKLVEEAEFNLPLVSEIHLAPKGLHFSFVIFPDGSKEYWSESDAGDLLRNEIIKYLVSLQYDDGSSPIAWVEVQYGDDNGNNKVIASSR